MAATPAVPHGRGLVYIAIAATAWGTGGAVAAVLYATSGLGPVAVSFWRFLGGAVLLGLVWPLLGGGNLWRRFTASPGRLLVTGAGLAVYQTAYFAAVGAAGVAVATVVTLGSGPVLIAVGARVWMGERLGRAGAVILGCAVVGLAMLVLGGDAGTGTDPVLGVGLSLLSALGYAGTTLLNRAMSTADDGGNPIGNAVVGFVVGSLCLLPFAWVAGLLPGPVDLGTTVLLLVYLGLAPSALAYALFFLGLTSVTATTAGVIALVEPLTAAVIGVVLLDERLTPAAVAGGVLLLAAVVVLALGSRPEAVVDPVEEGVH